MNNHLKKGLIGLSLVGAGSAVTANGFVMDKLANRANDVQVNVSKFEEGMADITSLSKINNQWQVKNKKEEITNHELTSSNQRLRDEINNKIKEIAELDQTIKNEINNKIKEIAALDQELMSKRKQVIMITSSLDKAREAYAKYQRPSRGHRTF